MRNLERMDDFFNTRANIYDDHMLVDLQLEEFYIEINKQSVFITMIRRLRLIRKSGCLLKAVLLM